MRMLLCLATLGSLAAHSPVRASDDAQEKTIARFFQAMAAGGGTIQEFLDLFGEGNEAEIGTMILVYFPRVKRPDRDPEVVRFVNARLAHPRQYRSEFLRCLSAAKPGWKSRRVPAIQRLPARRKGVVEYKVEAGNEVLTFVFGTKEKSIMNVLVNGEDNFGRLVLRCHPPSSNPGSDSSGGDDPGAAP